MHFETRDTVSSLNEECVLCIFHAVISSLLNKWIKEFRSLTEKKKYISNVLLCMYACMYAHTTAAEP